MKSSQRFPSPDILTCSTWTLAGAIAVILSTSYLLDGPDDIQAAQDVAEYAAAVADGGVAKCAEWGRTPKWTADGSLICRADKPPIMLAQGATP
jgi:hypothetical protein